MSTSLTRRASDYQRKSVIAEAHLEGSGSLWLDARVIRAVVHRRPQRVPQLGLGAVRGQRSSMEPAHACMPAAPPSAAFHMCPGLRCAHDGVAG